MEVQLNSNLQSFCGVRAKNPKEFNKFLNKKGVSDSFNSALPKLVKMSDDRNLDLVFTILNGSHCVINSVKKGTNLFVDSLVNKYRDVFNMPRSEGVMSRVLLPKDGQAPNEFVKYAEKSLDAYKPQNI